MNTSGYSDRLPPSPRQTQADERCRERLPPSRQRQHDGKEAGPTAPGSMFFACVSEFMPENDPLQEEAPSPDWQMLHHELRERIGGGAASDCAFTLLLPEAGEVDVTLAARQPVGWEIALRFPPQVWRHWQRREIQCRRLLSQSLNGPVRLSIEQGEAP
ncbi:type III secretion system HrpP C-terminal domain-containing protein [Erwinia amylovora]|uniref:Type III secretion protein HrpP n=4 Tax=Erwinia amylovora TaxID=552 RepID=A0A830ZT22_ERWAM|nr:type III secretion system HrpP C-terminal domain-containing protein [Erwinia amylovora]CBX79346.1 Type III secretion protein HrpP [Erwinia amylovora ATCC BAA-2158]CDK14130.1 Type III secretion protein HrpP [Erwinia amylovora LA635]CDK17497.1 Type III secretion protein HrpP [Erwinia amylovora LA636]CDK20866.1 Type III secretion protein HrpP [Erwinia amylovora LA637]AAB06003.1 HrpP [Erwinia amylovora]